MNYIDPRVRIITLVHDIGMRGLSSVLLTFGRMQKLVAEGQTNPLFEQTIVDTRRKASENSLD